MPGQALQIINILPDQTFALNEEQLSRILMHKHIKDRYVCVVSVAGAFRRGKSFLLSLFLKYLYATYVHRDASTWLGDEDSPLTGFSWRGGSESDTTGILMWSKLFLHDYANGDKIAVILLDTEGAFDSQSTVRNSATVFALSTMLSSVQIYNLSHNIQEDDLQHLHLFTEYACLAMEDIGAKPFQRLQFLVRDWSFPYEAEYGAMGGKKLLKKRLEISKRHNPEQQSLRHLISLCFEEIDCFLMPHPGLYVATNPTFDGRLKDIGAEFKEHLYSLVPMLLSPENLVFKEISGQRIRAGELMQYFQTYVNIYKGDELPEPESILAATAEANHLTAMAAAKQMYKSLMDNVCGGIQPYLSTAHLEAEHLNVKEKTLLQFLGKRKMGGNAFTQRFLIQLDSDLEQLFDSYKAHNENIFKAARTPAVYFAVAIVFNILSGIFGLMGLHPLGILSNIMMGIALLSLSLWAYFKYSGAFSDFGIKLDDIASSLWANVMQPIYQVCMQKGLEHVARNAIEHGVGGTIGSRASAAAAVSDTAKRS